MTAPATTSRPFEPGTTGWTAQDLDDPQIEREWMRGRYEIIEGVLTTMPAAYYTGGEAVANLMFLIKQYLKPRGVRGGFSIEVDIIIDEHRVVKADAVFLTREQKARQRQAAQAAGRRDVRRTRILVPPTLVIESISPGHEAHDERTKLRWYAEFGVANYWLLNAFDQTLRCLVLEAAAGTYREDTAGRNGDDVRPSMFPGLVIPLSEVWEE
jgi:Uma2 family endonuclease